MNWARMLTKVRRHEIAPDSPIITDPAWQRLRRSLKGKSLEEKYAALSKYLESNSGNRAAEVQVANYVNALKRGGLVK